MLPTMHRWTARFLALVMLVPAFGPLALARTSQSMGPHCLRTADHAQTPEQASMQCHHGMMMAQAPQSTETSFGAVDSCCQDHSCCRGLATPRWAQPQGSLFSEHSFLA